MTVLLSTTLLTKGTWRSPRFCSRLALAPILVARSVSPLYTSPLLGDGVMSAFLTEGADMDVVDENGATPLIRAVDKKPLADRGESDGHWRRYQYLQQQLS